MNSLTLQMHDELKPLYAKLLDSVSEYHKLPICTFLVQWGKNWMVNQKNGIAFYGRATNGWVTDSVDIEELFNGEERIFNRHDQMQWIEDYWTKATESGYMCNNSAFWRVMKKVAEHFYPDNWTANIVWSDVCKVAPWAGGNPSDSLYYAQLACSLNITEKELEILNPKHIVLFTGSNWAVDTLRYLNKGNTHSIDKIAWSNGFCVKVYRIGKRYFYLTEHPQGKKENDHATTLIELIGKYSQ